MTYVPQSATGIIPASNGVNGHGGIAVARRRFQRGQLIRSGDNWLGRWREDVADDTGAVKRVHKKEVIGTIEDLPTRRLALRELERRLEPINNVEYRPTRRVTFAVFAKRWQESVLVHQKRSSQSSARSHIKAHLVPAFGEMNLGDIRMEAIQQFVTNSKKSPKTVENIVTTMMSMWSTAQAWGYVQHNPFPRSASGRLLLKLPVGRPAPTYHFTVEEAMAIIDKAEGKWKTFFRILAETGMRPGECAGLRIEDVGDGYLSIGQSVWGQKVQTVKSKAGERTLAISKTLSEELKEMLAERGDEQPRLTRISGPGPALPTQPPRENSLVFTTEKGKPLSMDNFRQRVLNPILEELGLRGKMVDGEFVPGKLDTLGIARCGNYGFRHMNATLMDQLNTPMKTRQARLGHEPGSPVTLGNYTHAIDADDRLAADRIGALLASNTGTEAVQ